MNLDEIQKGLQESVTGFKNMQIALIVFSLLVTILLIIHTIKIVNK